MPIALYESMFVLDAGKMSTEADAVKGQLHGLLEKHGGEIVVSRPWDERKLAYPISKHKKGAFHIIYYKMETSKQAELENDLRIALTDTLIRHLTSAIDPKLADTMLQIARDEQGTAFALRGLLDDAPTDLTPATINDPAMLPGGEFGPVPNLNGAPAAGRDAPAAAGPGGRPGPRPPRRADGPEKPE